MSADLTLFALDPQDTAVRRQAHDLLVAEAVGDVQGPGMLSWDQWRATISAMYARPHVEVGQVSWLKTALSGGAERYIPAAVQRCVDLIGDGVLLTPGMAKAITVAFNLPNRSIYGRPYYEHVRDAERVAELRQASSRGCRRREVWQPTLLPGAIALHRGGRGVASGRTVKRFVQANLGAWLVQLSA